jgi:hypothetical protein
MENDFIQDQIEQLESKIDSERYVALQYILKLTDEKVGWFEDYIGVFVNKLEDKNSYQRTIGMLILCNLAKNETEKQEYKKILSKIMKLINDEKFITERQYIQNVWKIAVENDEYKDLIIKQMEEEFVQCVEKKHYNLIRQDIIQCLKAINKTEENTEINKKIKELIEKEEDIKNKKKYMEILGK